MAANNEPAFLSQADYNKAFVELVENPSEVAVATNQAAVNNIGPRQNMTPQAFEMLQQSVANALAKTQE